MVPILYLGVRHAHRVDEPEDNDDGGLHFLGLTVGWDAGPLGIVFSLAVIALAAFNLLVDFDLIERGIDGGAPSWMNWYAAFGLIVTIIWLYLEILRLLGKLQRR